MKRWRVYDGKRFVKTVRARTCERAQRAADALGERYGMQGPMVVVPEDVRVRARVEW